MMANVKKALFIHIFWSTILLSIYTIGVFCGFMLSYTICCIGIVIIFCSDFLLCNEPLYKAIIFILVIILLAPILMYVMWLFTIYHLISELERVV